jgi:hypothetical protein
VNGGLAAHTKGSEDLDDITTDVAEEVQPVRNTTHYSLRTKTSRPSSYRVPLSTEDEAEVDTTKDVGYAPNDRVEVQATDTTHSPELNRTLPSANEGAIAGATEIDSPLLAGSSHDDKFYISLQRK